MIRYADDALLGFESQQEAEEVLQALQKRLIQYGLELHPEKTRLVYFGIPGQNSKNAVKVEPDSFDFLGFTHYWGKSLKGFWIVKRKTAGKKFREKLKKIKEWCKENRHLPLQEQHAKLCRKIKGHYGYYGITGNARSLAKYLNEVTKIWKKWLNRRSSQGYRLNWDKFNVLLDSYIPLPPIKVPHSIYRVAKP